MKYIILDTETADLMPKTKLTNEDAKEIGFETIDDIPVCFQLSYSYFKGDKILDISDEVGKPYIDIAIGAQEVTGITNIDIDLLTKQEDGSNIRINETKGFKNLEFITKENKDVFIIGHNINYDIDVLKREGLDLSDFKVIDTLQLSRALNKDSEFHRLSYLLYSKEENVLKVREITKGLEGMEISKQGSIGQHNALFDISVTEVLLNSFKEILLERDGIDKDNVLEELHNVSITPFKVESIPFGIHKGKSFQEVDSNSLLWLLRNESSDINFVYTMDEEINSRGGLKSLIGQMNDYNLDKIIEAVTENEDFHKILVSSKEDRVEKAKNGPKMLGFGKHANTDIKDVDKNYLEWVLNNNSKPHILEMVKNELDYRGKSKKNDSIQDSIDAVKEKIVEDTSLEDFLRS